MSTTGAPHPDHTPIASLQVPPHQGGGATVTAISQLGAVPFTVCLLPTADRGALPVDIFESDGAMIIEGSLPGVRREEVEIDIQGNTITIRARPRPAPRQRRRRYMRRERYAGGWSRTIELPQYLATGALTWRLRRGIVTLRIAKHARPSGAAPTERGL
jgi:HSP20 family protein